MLLELQFVTYIRIFLAIVTGDLQKRTLCPFFGHCHVTFPNKDTLSFFARFVQKVVLSCFSDSFVQKTTQQADGSFNATSDSQLSNKLLKNSFFISSNTGEKCILSKEYLHSCHDDKMCILTNCRYHKILGGDLKELLPQLDTFCFNYITWTIRIHFWSTDSVAKLLSRMDNSLIRFGGQ